MSQSQSKSQVTAFRYWESVAEAPDTKAEIRYFGIVKRIPIAAFPKRLSELKRLKLEWDESPESMQRALSADLPISMQTWEPLPNGTVERFEAFDRDTGELLIFWRVPCRRRG